MMNMLADFVICIFEMYIFYDFLHDILERRFENGYAEAVILGIMSAVLFSVNQFDVSQLNLIVYSLLVFMGTMLLFCGGLKTRILYCLNFYVITLSMEFLTVVLFTLMNASAFPADGSSLFSSFYLIIITKLCTFVAMRFVKLFIKRQNMGMKGKLLKMAFLLPVTTILLYTGLLYADIQIERGSIALSIGCILLLFSNILVFYIMEKLACVMEQNSEYELMRLQSELNQVYYGKLEAVELKHKKYAHDLKEYLQTIGVLARQCKSEEIVDILKDMEMEIDNIPDKIYTNHSVLNALLCEKELQAQQKGIEFRIMIEPNLRLEKIKNGDLITMVGNLADNAIEAAVLCEKQKRIDLKFFASDGNFNVLSIENTYGNRIKKNGETYFSTKKDAKHHGIGIKSVRETAEKYGGLLFLDQKEDVFISILTLSKSGRN